MLAIYRPKRQKEITEDLAKLLDQLADPDVEARLLHLPALLMCKARRLRDGWTSKGGVNHPPKPKEACWMAAVAAGIEIELHLPLRIHDLTHLRLGEQVTVSQGNGRSASQVHLRVIANKNGRVVETWLRGEAAGILMEYLRDFRPLGPHPTTDWLFPGRDREDRPRAKNAFSGTIAEAIHEHTGVHVNVHAFRAFAAALILADHPHAIEDVRALLGHSTFEMAFRHYRRTNRQAAAQRLDDAINKRRQRSRAAFAPPALPLDLSERHRRIE
jgi:integrase